MPGRKITTTASVPEEERHEKLTKLNPVVEMPMEENKLEKIMPAVTETLVHKTCIIMEGKKEKKISIWEEGYWEKQEVRGLISYSMKNSIVYFNYSNFSHGFHCYKPYFGPLALHFIVSLSLEPH